VYKFQVQQKHSVKAVRKIFQKIICAYIVPP
jgi:hypothetical protein